MNDSEKISSQEVQNYEVTEKDIKSISQGIEVISDSGLFENGVIDEIRIVTFDSNNLYVFTKGEHASNDRFEVEEISINNKSGFRLFKIPRIYYDYNYKGAVAWLLCDEIESTAVNATKFPNEFWNHSWEPTAEEILDVVSIPPVESFEKFHGDKYSYLTDVMFHEVGHIEKRRLDNWQKGEEAVETFPSQKQEDEFKSMVESSTIFPGEVITALSESIDYGAISEMYAMLIDREALRRYRADRLEEEDVEFNKSLEDVSSVVDEIKNNKHTRGRLIVRIFEDKFPDFVARKEAVGKLLFRK